MSLAKCVEQDNIYKIISELKKSVDYLDGSLRGLRKDFLELEESATRTVDIEDKITALEQTINELKTIVADLVETVSTLGLGSNIIRLEQTINELKDHLNNIPRATGSFVIGPDLKHIEQTVFDLKTEMRSKDDQRHEDYLNLNRAIQDLMESVNKRFSDLDKSIGQNFTKMHYWIMGALLAILAATLKILS